MAPVPEQIEYVAYTPGWHAAPPTAPAYAPVGYSPLPGMPARHDAPDAAPRQPSIREMLAASQRAAQPDADGPYGASFVPGYPGPPFAPPYLPSAKRKTSSGLIALIIVLSLAAAGALGYGIWRVADQPDGGSSARTLVLPDSIDGYAQGPGDALAANMVQRETSQLAARYGQSFPADSVLAQVYEQPANSSARLVVFAIHLPAIAGAEQDLRDTGLEASMNSFADGFTDEQRATSPGDDVHLSDVNPGPQGGLMRCGAGSLDELPVDECLWLDNSYFVATLVSYPNGGDDARVSRDLRNAAEH